MLKNAVKTLLYRVRPQRLDSSMRLRLSYILHTEAIQQLRHWQVLGKFCREYRAVTGVEPICAIMTPADPRIRHEMVQHGCSDQEYLERVQELGEIAVIGHHGHYYTNSEKFYLRENEIREANYDESCVMEQFHHDVEWFESNGVSHNGLYTGGWWFTHPDLVKLLIAEGYRVDFSFTYSPVFGHTWSKQLMRSAGIRFGESFRLRHRQGSIALVQTLIGCHNTPFVDDFVRHMNALFHPEWSAVTGVVNNHDFNLTTCYDHTFKVLRHLCTLPSVSFWGREDIDTLAGSNATRWIDV